MAQRRMISKALVRSEKFLSLPPTAQVLYFHISVNADDDGFIDTVYGIQRVIRSKKSDLDALIKNGYLIPFGKYVFAVAHWNHSNKVRKDRYTSTIHAKELKQLYVDEDGVYHRLDEVGGGVDNNKTNICSASNSVASEPVAGPVSSSDGLAEYEATPVVSSNNSDSLISITLPLSNGEEYPVSPSTITLYKLSYPKLDIEKEYLKMKAWLLSHPDKQRDAAGIARFVSYWISKADADSQAYQSAKKPTAESFDPDEFMQLALQRSAPKSDDEDTTEHFV